MDWKKALVLGILAAVVISIACPTCRRRLRTWVGGTD